MSNGSYLKEQADLAKIPEGDLYPYILGWVEEHVSEDVWRDAVREAIRYHRGWSLSETELKSMSQDAEAGEAAEALIRVQHPQAPEAAAELDRKVQADRERGTVGQ